ncbi:MAG: hypothetical protein AB1610_11835 [Nitrospirota bacterium]
MKTHIRVFNTEEDFNAAKKVLAANGIKYTETPKPDRLPGNCSKGIVYNMTDGVAISSILILSSLFCKFSQRVYSQWFSWFLIKLQSSQV